MTRIVTSHYRYKRPPKRKKAVALEVPAVVRIERKTRRRSDTSDKAKAAPAESTSTISTRGHSVGSQLNNAKGEHL